MEKETVMSSYNHSISLIERKNMVITGVKKVDNFDDEEFLIETGLGYIIIKGEGLEVIKLDTIQGNISIKGLIKSFGYLEESLKKDKESSILARLFK